MICSRNHVNSERRYFSEWTKRVQGSVTYENRCEFGRASLRCNSHRDLFEAQGLDGFERAQALNEPL